MATNNIMLEVAAKTNTGMVREANEDNFVVTRDCTQEVWIVPKESYVNSDAGTVLVVADGMGGLNAGEVASKIAVDSMKEELTKLRSTAIEDKNIKSLLTNAIINAHKKIAKTGKDDPETEGMGSTIVVAWINDDKAHIGWVGDSRCYVCRNGKLMQLSKDHSYVQSLIDKGELTREQAFLHPESNIIMQSLGDSDHAPKPDYIAFSLANDDVLVLCSDGLNSMVRDDVIEKIVDENKSLADGTQMLIDEANHEGGHDNITVLMAKVINGANNNLPVQKITAETEISDSKIQRHPAVKKLQKTNRFLLYLLIFIAIAGIGYSASKFLKKPEGPVNGPVTTPADSGRAKAAEVNNDTGKGAKAIPGEDVSEVATSKEKEKEKDKDTDKDGVPDSRDDCAATPAGVKVNAKGCTIGEQEKDDASKIQAADGKDNKPAKNDKGNSKTSKEDKAKPPENDTLKRVNKLPVEKPQEKVDTLQNQRPEI